MLSNVMTKQQLYTSIFISSYTFKLFNFHIQPWSGY